jgi:small conductance mechanosensitive channel
MLASSTVTPIELNKRISTLTGIIRKALLAVVWSFAAVTILSELGFDIKPLLAGAGIVGLAVGFGAQNLVRDVISGLFFIFEDRIRVGDVAILNGTGGLVEQVNLRTMVLRGLDGTIHVFPNGAINTLSNMTYEYSYYLFDVGVAYKEDSDRVIAVLKEVGAQIMEEAQYREAILEPLEILGVDKFDDSAVVIKARIKTLPVKQWLVGREMNRRIKKRFDELGIEIPFPHRSLYFGEASKPISVKLEGLQERTEEIKALVRQVLKEQREGKS